MADEYARLSAATAKVPSYARESYVLPEYGITLEEAKRRLVEMERQRSAPTVSPGGAISGGGGTATQQERSIAQTVKNQQLISAGYTPTASGWVSSGGTVIGRTTSEAAKNVQSGEAARRVIAAEKRKPQPVILARQEVAAPGYRQRILPGGTLGEKEYSFGSAGYFSIPQLQEQARTEEKAQLAAGLGLGTQGVPGWLYERATTGELARTRTERMSSIQRAAAAFGASGQVQSPLFSENVAKAVSEGGMAYIPNIGTVGISISQPSETWFGRAIALSPRESEERIQVLQAYPSAVIAPSGRPAKVFLPAFVKRSAIPEKLFKEYQQNKGSRLFLEFAESGTRIWTEKSNVFFGAFSLSPAGVPEKYEDVKVAPNTPIFSLQTPMPTQEPKTLELPFFTEKGYKQFMDTFEGKSEEKILEFANRAAAAYRAGERPSISPIPFSALPPNVGSEAIRFGGEVGAAASSLFFAPLFKGTVSGVFAAYMSGRLAEYELFKGAYPKGEQQVFERFKQTTYPQMLTETALTVGMVALPTAGLKGLGAFGKAAFKFVGSPVGKLTLTTGGAVLGGVEYTKGGEYAGYDVKKGAIGALAGYSFSSLVGKFGVGKNPFIGEEAARKVGTAALVGYGASYGFEEGGFSPRKAAAGVIATAGVLKGIDVGIGAGRAGVSKLREWDFVYKKQFGNIFETTGIMEKRTADLLKEVRPDTKIDTEIVKQRAEALKSEIRQLSGERGLLKQELYRAEGYLEPFGKETTAFFQKNYGFSPKTVKQLELFRLAEEQAGVAISEKRFQQLGEKIADIQAIRPETVRAYERNIEAINRKITQKSGEYAKLARPVVPKDFYEKIRALQMKEIFGRPMGAPEPRVQALELGSLGRVYFEFGAGERLPRGAFYSGIPSQTSTLGKARLRMMELKAAAVSAPARVAVVPSVKLQAAQSRTMAAAQPKIATTQIGKVVSAIPRRVAQTRGTFALRVSPAQARMQIQTRPLAQARMQTQIMKQVAIPSVAQQITQATAQVQSLAQAQARIQAQARAQVRTQVRTKLAMRFRTRIEPPAVPFNLPRMDEVSRFKLPTGKPSKQKFAYTPSIFARVAGIRGRLPKGVLSSSQKLTGLELRPLPAGKLPKGVRKVRNPYSSKTKFKFGGGGR